MGSLTQGIIILMDRVLTEGSCEHGGSNEDLKAQTSPQTRRVVPVYMAISAVYIG